MTRPKLLLADDSVTIRKVIELTFEGEGIDVSAVTDAEAAMQKFVEIQPDIVLVDTGLEGTSGYHICEMIKQDDATKHIPVLLLVGSFEPFDQTEAERVQADGFLTKPFQSIREMVAQVWQLLGRQEDAATNISGYQTLEPTAADGKVNDGASQTDNGEVAARPPETADIDDLYDNSFAQTVEIDEFDTVDDLLGDTGMDDEMIEASYPSSSFAETIQNYDPAIDVPAEQTKQFDWSPESIVSESPAELPIDSQNETRDPEVTESSYDEEPKPSEHLKDDDFQTAIGETVSSLNPPSIVNERATDDFNQDNGSEAVEINDQGTTNASTDNGFVAEPSAELIEMIARRVVERLSDDVIRDIAKDAVPRIAEKLIREALEDETKH